MNVRVRMGHSCTNRVRITVRCKFRFRIKLWLEWELGFGFLMRIIIRVTFWIAVPCEWE